MIEVVICDTIINNLTVWENENMAEYQNNEATQIAKNKFEEFEGEYRDVPGKDYIKTLNAVAKETTFYQKTYKHAQKHGFDGAEENTDSLSKFIF